MDNIITLKNLREKMVDYCEKIEEGQSFIVFKKSKPVFKISPIETGEWEEVIDFTRITKGGVDINELLSRL